MRSVLVTRPQPAADELAGKLRRAGFEVCLAPLAEYIELPCDFAALQAIQALVFTSAEAVRVFAARVADRSLTIFAVGEATAKEASKAGFARVWQAEGSSDDVLRLIRQKKGDLQLKRLLHVCGEDVSQDLAAALIGDGIAVERKVVYKTRYAEKLPAAIEQALSDGTIETVTLFSPRAAAHFVKLLQQRDLRDASARLEAVCLSPRVADEIAVLPWRKIEVAPRPHTDAVIEVLKESEAAEAAEGSGFNADAVIDAFGGIRPLANRLGLPASTVQGWKKRGVIPLTREADIIHAAQQDRIDTQVFKTASPGGRMESNKQETAAPQERRTGSDRRQGDAKNYAGPERRTGLDRRAFLEHQKRLIAAEKRAFAFRAIATCTLTFTALAAAGIFLFAPEYVQMRQNAARVAEVEAQMKQMNDRLYQMQQAGEKQNTLGSEIASRLEQLQVPATAAAAPVPAVGDKGIESYVNLIARVNSLKKTPEGAAAFAKSMERLSAVLPESLKSAQDANGIIEAARKQDPLLQSLFDGIEEKHLGGAALLLGVNEFNANVARRQPFEADLNLLKKFGAGDPAFETSANALAAYAKTGVTPREALQKKFRGIAMDIVMAKLEGEDLTLQQKALKRMGDFVRLRKVDDVTGDTVDAVVARADMLLEQGDVASAARELSALEGKPRVIAQGWLDAAQGYVDADGIAGAIVTSLTTGISAALDAPADGLVLSAPDAAPALPAAPQLPSFKAQ